MYLYFILISLCRHYVKNSTGRIENAPYVDLSYKWAGGGLTSNVTDLIKFGNMMLYSYQYTNDGDGTNSKLSDNQTASKNSNSGKHGLKTKDSGQDMQSDKVKGQLKTGKAAPFLKPETVKQLWTVVDRTTCEWGAVRGGGYGLGWGVWDCVNGENFCRSRPFFVSHTGGAIGASSVLVILPSPGGSNTGEVRQGDEAIPKGVVVSIIVNMTSVGLNRSGLHIAKMFEHAS